MSHQRNVQRIKAVSRALQGLQQPVVFVGGATVSLYAPALAASEVRPTDDVDVVVELASYADYGLLEEKLRTLGFQNDVHSKVICRYQIQGITVDIMPLGENVLGFSNRWYPEGFRRAVDVEIEPNLYVKIFSPPYFIASKLEAFKNRGSGDYRTSTDFEDIIYVLENHAGIGEKLSLTTGAIRTYLKTAFAALLNDPYLEEGIYAHVTPAFAAVKSQHILEILKKLAI